MNILFEQRAVFTRSWSESSAIQTSVDNEEEVAFQRKAAHKSHRQSIKIEDKKCEKCGKGDPVVAYCPDCHLALCFICTESHKSDEVFLNHSILTLTELRSKKAASRDKAWLCKEHDYELKHYCETCEQLVCLYCTTKEHSSHVHDTIKTIASKHRNQLKEDTAPVENMIKELSEACNRIDKIGSEIEKQGKKVDMEIDKYYHELIEKLKVQREEIKQQAHNIVSQKMEAITAQLKEMKQLQADMGNIKELRDSLGRWSDQDTLSTKKQVIDRMQRLTVWYKKLNTKPVETPSVTFLPTKRQPLKFGQVFSTVDPEASEVKHLPKFTFKGTKVEFKVITNYSNGRQYPHGGNRVSVELESNAGEVATVHVTDNNDGSYTACFVAQQVGSLELSISVNGKHIKGSPYSVVVSRNYPAIDKPSKIIDNNGKMGVPWGVAFGNHGIWAVADYANHCIYVYDAHDQLTKKFGSRGANPGQFQSPGGVAFDADNHLYVADHYNNRIQKFNINGTYLLQFGNQRSGEDQLNCPVGVVTHKSKVYVTEEHSNHVSVFQMDGQFCQTIGQGHLSGTFDVAINANDQLLVADCGHNCIFIFGLGGHYVGKFGPRGTGRGQLSNPRSLVTDPNGFIFVAEYGNHRISIFDQFGNFMHCFGSRGSLEGQFQYPHGIALSPNGSIYVSDGYGKRIQIFSTY